MNTYYYMTWHRLYSILYTHPFLPLVASPSLVMLLCSSSCLSSFLIASFILILPYLTSLFLPPSLLPFFCLFLTEFPHCLPLLSNTEFSCYSSPSLQTILQSLQWIWEALVPTLWSSPTSSSPHVWAASSQGWLQAQEPVRWQTVRLRPTSTPVPQGGLLWTILV